MIVTRNQNKMWQSGKRVIEVEEELNLNACVFFLQACNVTDSPMHQKSQ